MKRISVVKKRKKIIIIIIFICITSFYFGCRFIKFTFWEENTAESLYDENFVLEDNSIELQGSDLTEIQSEILRCVSEWKEVCDLSYINVYLDSNLDLNTVVFVYQLDDIENYIGRLEVKCTNENNSWKIVRAESIYFYDEDKAPNSSENQLEDNLLTQKIQAVVEFIKSKEDPRLDLYLISINGDNIHIDAHNTENENTQNNWQENCIIYQEEGEMFIESNENDS